MEKIENLKQKTEDSDFWNDQSTAQNILQEIKKLEKWVEDYQQINEEHLNLHEFAELAEMEEDESLLSEIENDLAKLKKNIEDLEFKSMLSGRDQHGSSSQ